MNTARIAMLTTVKFALMVGLLLPVGCRTNETPEKQVSDAEILTNVKTKLARGLGASSVTNISVNSTEGVVTLSGIVHNSAEQARAVEIAKSVPKVVRVNNSLQVESGT